MQTPAIPLWFPEQCLLGFFIQEKQLASQNVFLVRSDLSITAYLFLVLYRSTSLQSLSFLKNIERCGARLGGSKSNAVNLILRLFLYNFLHMMSSWCHKSIHNSTNNQQTPPPWWWSRLPLQRHGFNESTLSEWRAALCIHFSRPLSKILVKFNKLM